MHVHAQLSSLLTFLCFFYQVASLVDELVCKTHVREQLDELAAEVRERLGGAGKPASSAATIAAMNEVLFVTRGFAGDIR